MITKPQPLSFPESLNHAGAYDLRNLQLKAFIADARARGNTLPLDINPDELPGALVVSRDDLNKLLSGGGDAVVMMFAVGDLTGADNIITQNNLTLMLLPFDIATNRTLPHMHTVDKDENIVSSNCVMLKTKCCPVSELTGPRSFSACINNLLNSNPLDCTF